MAFLGLWGLRGRGILGFFGKKGLQGCFFGKEGILGCEGFKGKKGLRRRGGLGKGFSRICRRAEKKVGDGMSGSKVFLGIAGRGRWVGRGPNL